jgi:hypothetical protein
LQLDGLPMNALLTETPTALAQLTAYCFPGGEAAARGVRGIRTLQRGEIRSGPEARWNPFTAEEFVDATRTAFRWEARIGGGLITSVRVTDAYENGAGRLVVKKGPLTLKTLVGPEVDEGEVQRYLAYVGYCPPMILNNPSLEITEPMHRTLRVRDQNDATGASVDIELGVSGRAIVSRAIRPMIVGRRVIFTPWSATGSDTQELEGLRLWRRMEASWNPPGGAFTYVRLELTSITIVR